MRTLKVRELTRVLAACSLGGMVLGAMPVHASQTFTSAQLGGEATFTAGIGTLEIVLNDTFATPSSLADLLSDLHFTIAGAGDVSSTNYSVPNTGLITLLDGHATSTSTGTAGPWTLSGTGGNFTFTGLNGGSQTNTLIIGPVASDICQPTKCPDGLGTQNNNFVPYIDQTVTFNLAISGVGTDSQVSNVLFSFGTSGETVCSEQSCTPVPIPAAVWLFGSGLLGLIGIARRKYGTSSGAPATAMA